MARDFDKANEDHIAITGMFGNPSNLTLSAWVSFDSQDTSGGEVISLSNLVTLRLKNVVQGFYFDGTNFQFTTASEDLAGTGWHHVLFYIDDTNDLQKIFIDGIEVGSSTNTTSINYTSGTNTEIGRHPTNNAYDYDGRIAEVAVWSTILSQDEIEALGKGGSPAKIQSGSLEAYLPLLGDASPEPDLSGNSNDGTVTGASPAEHVPFAQIGVTEFEDDVFRIKDDVNDSKILEFSLGGATADKTATVVSSHTDNRTITLPDATDTLVGKDTVDILTSKTIDANNNTLLNLPSSFSGKLSDLDVDADKDWANKKITNVNNIIPNQTTGDLTLGDNTHRFELFIKQFIDFQPNTRVAIDGPATDDARLFLDVANDHLTIKKVDGQGVPIFVDLEDDTWSSDIDADGFDLQDLSNIEFRSTTQAPSNSTPSLWADGSGIKYNVSTDDFHSFRMNGTEIFRIAEDELTFQAGRAHSMRATNSNLQMFTELKDDTFEVWNGTSGPEQRTNATLQVNDVATTWLTEQDVEQAVLLQLIQNHNTPSNDRTIGNIDFMAENTDDSNEIYARISATSKIVTDGDEQGLLQLGVVSDGDLVSGIDIEGGTSVPTGAKIGFFGATPVARPTSVASTTTAIIDALKDLGLFG